MWWQVAAAGIAGSLAAGVAAFFIRRKTAAEVIRIHAEVRRMDVDTAERVVHLTAEHMEGVVEELNRVGIKLVELERRLTESDKDRERLSRQVAALQRHIDILETEMRSHGMEPPPRPRTGSRGL